MNSLEVRLNLPEHQRSTLADNANHGEEFGPYQLLPRASLPLAHLSYTLDRWLADFNRPWKAIARGGSPSALRHAANSDSLDELLTDTALPAGSRRVPPPKAPTAIQSTEADDDG